MKSWVQKLNNDFPPILLIFLSTLGAISILIKADPNVSRHVNMYYAVIVVGALIATHVFQKQRKCRVVFSSIFLALLTFKIVVFFIGKKFEYSGAIFFLDQMAQDFTLLQINVVFGAFTFFVSLLVSDLLGSSEEPPWLWLGFLALVALVFVSFGMYRPFFDSYQGFRVFSLSRIDPIHALMVISCCSPYILKCWHDIRSSANIYRASILVAITGSAILSLSLAAVEKQIFDSIESKMETKFSALQLRVQNSVEERIRGLSLLADFVATNPERNLLHESLVKTKNNVKALDEVYFFDRSFALRWVFQQDKISTGRDAEKILKSSSEPLLERVRRSFGYKITPGVSPDGNWVEYIAPVVNSRRFVGFLFVRSQLVNTVQLFFSKYDYGSFVVYLRTPKGEDIFAKQPVSVPPVMLNRDLHFIGTDIEAKIVPDRAFLMNTVLIPQMGLMVSGLAILILVVILLYNNRRRVTDIEREVVERTRDLAIAQQEALRAKKTAENANYSKSQFLANMSHEIRTPLNVLLGVSDLLYETELGSEQRKYVDLFRSSGRHLLDLVNDIIDLSRVEAGQLEIERIPFDLHRTLDFVKKLFMMRAEAAGIKFIIDTSRLHGSRRMGDPLRTRQILVNLVGNALKFTTHGMIRIQIWDTHDQVIFEVEDTGSGISEEFQREIFSSFTQGDVSFTRKHGGAGLGLSICKSLCDIMNGEIGVESKLGVGSKFTVRLPMLPVDPVEIEVPSSSPEPGPPLDQFPGGTPKNVLLVDDSDDNRFLFQLFLKSNGISLKEAVNGEEAVNLVKAGHFDLILMDMQMPVMDGYEAVRRIRDHEKNQGLAQVPILALTAHGVSTEKEKCLAAGCSDFLAKPVGKKTLLLHVQRLLSEINI